MDLFNKAPVLSWKHRTELRIRNLNSMNDFWSLQVDIVELDVERVDLVWPPVDTRKKDEKKK